MTNSRNARIAAWGAAAALALPLMMAASPATAATPDDPENGPYWAVPAEQIGVVGFTIRSQIGQDALGTLTATQSCGITNYEFSGSAAALQGKSPAELAEIAEQLDLNVPSIGVSGTDLSDRIDEVAEAANLLGAKFVRISGSGTEPAQFEAIAANMEAAGIALAPHGIRVAYHNHGEVFPVLSNGKTGLEILAENTTPERVGFELDLYWAVAAGADPVEIIQQFPGRFPLFHVKDRKDGTFATVGQGDIDFQRIFAYRELAGVEWYFIENDQPQPDGITSACESYAYLTTSPAVDEAGIPLTVEVDGAGSLALTVAYFGAGVDLGDSTRVGDALRYTAQLPKISVTDTRRDDRGWSVTGQSSDFTSGAHGFTGDHLGWTPSLLKGETGVTAGASVAGTLAGGPGLAIPAYLAQAGEDSVRGTTVVGAELELLLPAETETGRYAGTLTVSLFAED